MKNLFHLGVPTRLPLPIAFGTRNLVVGLFATSPRKISLLLHFAVGFSLLFLTQKTSSNLKL